MSSPTISAGTSAAWAGSVSELTRAYGPLVVTDRRLVVQGMNRRFEPDGEPLSLPPERIAEAKAEGGGGGWMDLEAAVMDAASVALKIRTTDGEKLKLMMMRAEGPLGGLGGGETQGRGIQALGAWFAENA